MRILAGCICRQDVAVLEAHLETLKWQKGDFDVDLFHIDDNDVGSDASAVLGSAGGRVERSTSRPEGATYAVDSETHRWAVPTFYHLARNKQRILDVALEEGYDAVWLVDTDLLCDPGTLASLVATEKPIASAVFWTRWSPGDDPLPQVWQQHPYGFDGGGWTTESFLRELRRGSLLRVRGLGACTLIRREALEAGAAFWPLIDGLPTGGMWQGEDRHFCVRAERLHIEMWADAWPTIVHLYRPEDRAIAHESLQALESACAADRPTDGNLLSFTVEPCEEPQLIGYKEFVRGRLGMVDVLPDIEVALREMRAGDSRFIHAAFPAEWPIAEYRGQRRTLRVRLLDVRAA